MHRLVRSIVPLVLLLGACTDAPQPTAPGDARRDESEAPANTVTELPLPGLSAADSNAFVRGKYLFQKLFNQAKGLGPTFNARSCAECHGGNDGKFSGTGNRLEFHFTRLNADGSCSTLANHGGFVKQDSATNALKYYTDFDDGEPFPTVPHDTARRITPDLFGSGLIAAIPEAAILAHADPNDADNDGISGRAHMVNGVLGRFGRKAEGTDLDRFNAGALLREMGMTNPEFMVENSVGSWAIESLPDSVDPTPPDSLDMGSYDLAALNAFVRFLAPLPSKAPSTPEELEGEDLFTSTGCGKCHTPQAYTTASTFSALNGKTVRPFSDFLLHDMGSQPAPHLGDICLLSASRTEFRTEPLMGARFMSAFMHDGLATSIDQAILQHGGEAAAARNAYSTTLTAAQRQALIAYINTL
ncbi:MAG: di-heme oxidoredictase family protein [Longimicrobiaceae bacterium]